MNFVCIFKRKPNLSKISPKFINHINSSYYDKTITFNEFVKDALPNGSMAKIAKRA